MGGAARIDRVCNFHRVNTPTLACFKATDLKQLNMGVRKGFCKMSSPVLLLDHQPTGGSWGGIGAGGGGSQHSRGARNADLLRPSVLRAGLW